jgi:hypothetical protein
MRNELKFKQTENGFEIATAQEFNVDDFCKRVANFELQKHYIMFQIDTLKNQNKKNEQDIEMGGKHLEDLSKDLGMAFDFLDSINRPELKEIILAKVEEMKNELPKQ